MKRARRNTMRSVLTALTILLLPCVALRAQENRGLPHIHYSIDVAQRAQHRLHVSVVLDPGHEQASFQLPSWYALYQIRNFSQFLRSPKAFAPDGSLVPSRSVDKATWAVTTQGKAARFEYDFVCNLPGPYGLEVSADRITINPALLLVYFPEEMNAGADVTFKGVPADWQTASTLAGESEHFSARNYEALVDSPFWLGHFAQQTYTEEHTTIRIQVDAASSDYDMPELVRRNKELVAIESQWMGGLPTDRYTFFYHFAADAGEEGMEHADGTFISASASATRASMSAVDNVTAHEFFHLWNVTRIRPCSMEPVDFAHEQYTPTLWFSEGFTSAASRLFLLRSGYLTSTDFLSRMAANIHGLQAVPANSWQSAQDASLSVWLSGTEAYDSPERSISFYRKGELLAYLLDLRMRQETDGSRSLQDLFRFLQVKYGLPRRCFEDADALQASVEALTGRPESAFFNNFVSGHEALPFADSLNFLGLNINATGIHERPDASASQIRERAAWLGPFSSTDKGR